MAEILYETLPDGLALVTLDRPEKRNAINPGLAAALDRAVKRSEADPAVRVVILASSSPAVFSAGADLAVAAAGEGHRLYTPDGGFAGFVHAARRKPWIAAVRGRAVGGGFELCLACDMIVAGEDAEFSLPEVQRGLLATAGGAWRLPRRIPRNLAIEMVTTGEPLDARRAHALGLVNRVAAPDAVLETASALGRRIADNAPLSVQAALDLTRRALWLDDDEAQAAADAALSRLRDTEDFAEGPRAFLEKRAPVWKGR